MNLLKLSLIISILGIFLLFLLSAIIKPQEINSAELNSTKENYVKISGKIIKEKVYDEFSILILQDNFGIAEISCFSCKNFINKTVIVEGKIQNYKNQKQIQAEKIQEK